MAHFDINVDTKPMAQSLDSVSRHVDGTTTAVVGMQAAVIKAELDAADHVCENVNHGFYAMLRSQISQKLAKLQSDVESLLLQLNQQVKQLKGIQTRMGRDYNMITRRYIKTFDSINRSLKQRVIELDRPVFDLATRDMDQISNRLVNMTATVPVSQNESVRQSQRILMSNIKHRGRSLVHSIDNFLEASLDLQQITREILLPERIDRDERQVYVPVVVCEGRLDGDDNRSTSIHVSSSVLSQKASASVEGAVRRSFDSLPWREPEKPSDTLRGSYTNYVEADASTSKRVKEMVVKMFNESEIGFTCKV